MSISINFNKEAYKQGFHKGINTKEFIEQVRKRPILYDYKLAHGNQEGKGNAWREVAASLMEEKWATFNSNEKDAIIKEFEVKWKSLRDYFRKYVKTVEEAKAGKKTLPKKYFYYEDLVFLAPYMNTIKAFSTFSDENNDASNSIADADMTTEQFKIEQADDSSYEAETIQVGTSDSGGFQFIQIPSTQVIGGESVGKDSTDKRIAAVLEEMVNLQKEEKNDDPMGNRKFLLSLLPFMRKLPDDVNLEVRLQLMSVLQTYTRT